jgi:serine/threonine-protein kinase
LKPTNITVTADRVVKIMEFGIARWMPSDADPAVSSSATATALGAVIGTAAYMSPEQARGEETDKRVDIWAFGCLLYELLCGTPAFTGATSADTIAAILNAEPDWSLLPADTPLSVRRLLRRCLRKDRAHRLHDIADARIEIDEARDASDADNDGVSIRQRPKGRRTGWLAVAAACGALVASGVTWTLLHAPAVDPGVPLQYTIVPPPTQLIAVPGFRRSIAVSPDGRYVAYFSGFGNMIGPLVLRRLDQLDGRLVPGVRYAGEVTFSPDARWMAFVDGLNTIRKVPVDGGPPLEIRRNQVATGSLTWGDDDAITFSTVDSSTGLLRISANGGEVEVLTRPDPTQNEVDHTEAFVLPHGRGVLFAIVRSGGVSDTAVLDLKTRRYKTLVRGSTPHYVTLVDGAGRRREFVVFAVDNSIRAVPFDGDRLELGGDPVILADQVYTAPTGHANYSISQTGTLVYMPATATPARSLVWVDRKGSITPIQGMPVLPYESPRLSPDGTVAAFIVGGRDHRLATWNFKTERLTRLGAGHGLECCPVWMPDGPDLLFGSTRNGRVINVYRQAADGSAAAVPLFPSVNQHRVQDVVRDGAQALVLEDTTKGPSLLLVHTVAGRGNPRVLLANAETSRLSPDGRFVAYVSMESGDREVYVRPFPDVTAARWQVSRGGATAVAWSRDGTEIFYLDPSDAMMAARATRSGAIFSIEPPQKLFDASFARAGEWIVFDVAADGRFLMPKPETGPAGSTSSTLVVKTRAFDVFK